MSTATVKLKFTDVLGVPLDDRSVVVDIFSLDNSTHFRAVVPLTGQTDAIISLKDLDTGVYRFQLIPTNYRMLQFFLRLTEGETTTRETIVFPVDPARVSDISAPAFAALDGKLRDLLTASSLPDVPLSGAGLYDALPPKRKAALLNLFTKSSNTMLGDQTSCFDHLAGMVDLAQDRLFAKADAALVEETMQSRGFRPVDFTLHTPKPDYHLISSFKTRDPQGNLQLTFSRKGESGADYIVDMDIDEAKGIEHAFEVIKNSVAGPTDPYNVRDILASSQKLRPLYTFVFAAQGVAQMKKAAAGG